MSLPFKSQQELYDLFINTLQNNAPQLTDILDGSIIDALGGVFSIAGMELQRYNVVEFSKTFISLAQGPDENDGGPDDLQTLAVDHFGSAFARPSAVAAVDTATFSRATTGAGNITIPAGTVIKTNPDANGNTQRYTTNSAVTMTGLSVSVGITAVVAGAAGDAAANTITVIESTLLDSTIVVTNAGNATGEDAQDSPTYRQTIMNLIESLAGATSAAVEAKAKTVAGVSTATAIEQALTVIQYNIATGLTVGNYFRIPVPSLYIADSLGGASVPLIQEVLAAIESVRACGVFINVIPATAVTVSWTAHMTLNPSGPNYSTLVNNAQQILNSMTDYINNLPVGTGFVRATANAAILAIWGPAGTNDLTAFTTSVPSGDVAATSTQKMIAGTVTLN